MSSRNEGLRERLGSYKAYVSKVTINGLERTKDDYVHNILKDCFEITNVRDLVEKVKDVRETLLQIGAFKEIKAKIDVTPNTKYGYIVDFYGVEQSRIKGNISTEMNQYEMVSKAEILLPNLFGRGESLSFDYAYSNSDNSRRNLGFNVKLLKPFLHRKYIGKYRPQTFLHLFDNTSKSYNNSYNNHTAGGTLNLVFNTSNHLQHTLQYELSFRELAGINRQVPLFVRQHFGPRLASIVRYIMKYDDRTDRIFPRSGTMLWTTLESSIFRKVGDIHYMSITSHLERNLPLFWNMSLQMTARGGFMRELSPEKPIPINSLFTMGGPYSLRGFEFGGVGPQIEGHAPGTHMFWATGLHLWAPLPYSSYFYRFARFFRTHLFFNCGNVDSNLDTMRSAAGIGLAVALAQFVRIELNFTRPIHRQKGDQVAKDVSFCLGLDFI
ncbi:SAM50-like protein CG7639 [Phlebotomus papatasi]|uniref:Bacterial surface antigen (D15) domain-containing protein n=1 Tax=Phlebotomus papatasi TaxID=29031 RepID=A0A1B0DEJ0_PHLPP|nr:SAM50-like protein CG7639 [Phlebotomus papatasi]